MFSFWSFHDIIVIIKEYRHENYSNYWITIPQKLGKKQSKALQVNDTHSHCLQIYMHFHKCMCFYFKNIYVS